MKILAVIPARGGSKGVPKKNIKPLGNKPLLGYTIDSANQSEKLTTTIVSTDSEEIAEIAKANGASIPFIRPKELAEDKTPTIEVLKHAIRFFEDQGKFFDAICILQPTTPFRREGFIDEAIDKFIRTNADTLISVLPVPHQFNPHWVFEVSDAKEGKLKIATGEKTIIPRRQELPQSYYRDGSVYLIKTEWITKHNTLFGETIGYIESASDDFVNIDTMEDWVKAEEIARQYK